MDHEYTCPHGRNEDMCETCIIEFFSDAFGPENVLVFGLDNSPEKIEEDYHDSP